VDINENSGLTDQFLGDLEAKCLTDLKFSDGEIILRLIAEVRRLKSLLPPPKKTRPKNPPREEVPQCKAVRTLGGQPLRCTAAARYGDYCGRHRPNLLKGKSKGCTAISRSGQPCKGIAIADNLCPSHWERLRGHDYIRDGPGFRCQLCGASFDFWTVEGRGKERRGSIKRVTTCPGKIQK
jgi:hypothetical protein